MDRRLKNFILKGGRLIDSASGLDGQQDVHVRDGVVAAIGADLKAEDATLLTSKIALSHRD